VLHGLASFEEQAPSAEEIARRRADALARGYPYIVAERVGRVVGYAYAAAYRARPAYRFAVENSIYIDQEDRRGGIGSALLPALIERCTARGYRQMIAVIGDSANAASINLHAKFGFQRVGTFASIGWKHGRWVDSVLMQLALGEGDGSAPPGSASA
jgi:phosphinothricin acetyltransferase